MRKARHSMAKLTASEKQETLDFIKKEIGRRDTVGFVLGCLVSFLAAVILSVATAILWKVTGRVDLVIIGAIVLGASLIVGSLIGFAHMLFIRLGLFLGSHIWKSLLDEEDDDTLDK